MSLLRKSIDVDVNLRPPNKDVEAVSNTARSDFCSSQINIPMEDEPNLNPGITEIAVDSDIPVLQCTNVQCTSTNEINNDDSNIANLVDVTDNINFDQETHDALFEAGYSIDEINVIAASGSLNMNTSLDSEILEPGNGTLDSDELHGEDSDPETENENANVILRKLRIKNVNRIVIGSLNINSLSTKFDQLKEVIGKNLDILTIQETKLDSSFPPQQFIIEGYSEPYRLDRNREGGGVLIYVREDIPSKLLTKHNFTQYVEGLFIEINLRKTKLLFFGGYRSEHPEYGLSKSDLSFKYLFFRVDRLIMAFRKTFVMYGLSFALNTFCFIGACFSKILKNVTSK